MAHCKECGEETIGGMRLCYHCLDGWKERRKKAFDIAEAKHGKLCKDNHELLTREVKKIERKLREEKVNIGWET